MTAAACFIHSQLGLPPDCLSWDLGLWKLESIGPLVWGGGVTHFWVPCLQVSAPGTHCFQTVYSRPLDASAPSCCMLCLNSRNSSLGWAGEIHAVHCSPRRQGSHGPQIPAQGGASPRPYIDEVPFKSGLEIGQHSGLLEVSAKAWRGQTGPTFPSGQGLRQRG